MEVRKENQMVSGQTRGVKIILVLLKLSQIENYRKPITIDM